MLYNQTHNLKVEDRCRIISSCLDRNIKLWCSKYGTLMFKNLILWTYETKYHLYKMILSNFEIRNFTNLFRKSTWTSWLWSNLRGIGRWSKNVPYINYLRPSDVCRGSSQHNSSLSIFPKTLVPLLDSSTSSTSLRLYELMQNGYPNYSGAE